MMVDVLDGEEPHDYSDYQYPLAAYLSHCIDVWTDANPMSIRDVLFNIDEVRHVTTENAMKHLRPDLWR
jgi:hypothetical protein